MSGLRFESMADMPPRMREAYARQMRDLFRRCGAGSPSQGEPWEDEVRQPEGYARRAALRQPEGSPAL